VVIVVSLKIARFNQNAFVKFYDASVTRDYDVALRIARRPSMAAEIISKHRKPASKTSNRFF